MLYSRNWLITFFSSFNLKFINISVLYTQPYDIMFWKMQYHLRAKLRKKIKIVIQLFYNDITLNNIFDLDPNWLTKGGICGNWYGHKYICLNPRVKLFRDFPRIHQKKHYGILGKSVSIKYLIKIKSWINCWIFS